MDLSLVQVRRGDASTYLSRFLTLALEATLVARQRLETSMASSGEMGIAGCSER
jgi:hypothetical protein